MKKTILTLLVAFAALAASAQKPDTAKKAPQWAPDVTKQYTVDIPGVTLAQLNNYLTFEQYGANLDSSDKLSGAQITAIKKDASVVIMAINKKFNDILADDKAKWDKAQKGGGK